MGPFERQEPRLQQQPAKDLLQELLEEGKKLIRQEMALARAELVEEGKKLLKAGRNVALGGVLAHAALLTLVAFACLGLAAVMPAWAAALVVGVVLALIAGGLIYAGVRSIKAVRAVPPETKQTLEEDRQWAQRTMRAARSNVRARA